MSGRDSLLRGDEVQPDTAAPGDDGSFEAFFESNHARLFGALAVMARNRSEAEEIMQDAFLTVWERWDRVAAMDEPVSYLYRVALNLYRKRLRRAAVVVRKTVRLLPADDAMGGVETRDEAARLLHLLTPREREALVLTAYLGYSGEEAARLMGIRASTVRVLISRARALVRQTAEESP
jgi:RNA polymerase sigma-70 factor (ECF subfamily)